MSAFDNAAASDNFMGVGGSALPRHALAAEERPVSISARLTARLSDAWV